MKRIILILIVLMLGLVANGQEQQDYVVEDNGDVSFYKVLTCKDGKTKDALFNIVESYFAYNYNDGKSVIQTTNREKYYIVGSGIYADIHEETNSFVGWAMLYSVPHVIRIDCKDGKVRAIITVSVYKIRKSNWMYRNRDVEYFDERISANYPIAPQSKPNKLTNSEERGEEAYKALKIRIDAQFNAIEDAINQGNSVLENEDW